MRITLLRMKAAYRPTKESEQSCNIPPIHPVVNKVGLINMFHVSEVNTLRYAELRKRIPLTNIEPRLPIIWLRISKAFEERVKLSTLNVAILIWVVQNS